MSDIGIRLDGLLLAAAIVLALLVFAAVSLVAAILASGSPQRTRWMRLAKDALGQCGVSAVCLLGVILYMNAPGQLPQSDWIDWLTVPWVLLFIAGLARLFWRYRSAGRTS